MASEQDWRVTLRAGISDEIRERLNLHDEQDINLVLCRLGAALDHAEARVKELEEYVADNARWLSNAAIAFHKQGGHPDAVFIREQADKCIALLAPNGGSNAG